MISKQCKKDRKSAFHNFFNTIDRAAALAGRPVADIWAIIVICGKDFSLLLGGIHKCIKLLYKKQSFIKIHRRSKSKKVIK